MENGVTRHDLSRPSPMGAPHSLHHHYLFPLPRCPPPPAGPSTGLLFLQRSINPGDPRSPWNASGHCPPDVHIVCPCTVLWAFKDPRPFPTLPGLTPQSASHRPCDLGRVPNLLSAQAPPLPTGLMRASLPCAERHGAQHLLPSQVHGDSGVLVTRSLRPIRVKC